MFFDDEGGEDSQYLMKKAVGNVIDVAGLTVLHLSPLWVLALFSDVTMGTKKYLNTLADELKKQGVLEKSATIDSIDSILDSLQKTSGILADNLDTPPLTVEQLKESGADFVFQDFSDWRSAVATLTGGA